MQKGIQKLLIGVDQRIQFGGDSEDDMEVWRVNHLRPAAVNPDLFQYCLAVGTITVAAGIAVEVRVPAVVTDADIVAASSGLAVHDGVSSLVLDF